MTVAPGNFAGEHGTDGTIGVAHGQVYPDRCFVIQGITGKFDQFVIKCLVESMVLLFSMVNTHAGSRFRLVQDTGEIQALCLPVINGLAHVQVL